MLDPDRDVVHERHSGAVGVYHDGEHAMSSDDCDAVASAERSVVLGLGEHDLPDVFRALNGYTATDASWLARSGGQSGGRRYDHIFASRRLAPTACRYVHA